MIRVVVFKEVLMIKIEISLNFLDISDEVMEILGLTFDEPLLISLHLNESRIYFPEEMLK